MIYLGIDAKAVRKLVEMNQEQADAENEMLVQVIEAAAAMEAEIAMAQDGAVAKALKENLQDEDIIRLKALEETRKFRAAEQQAVVREAERLKKEVVTSTDAKLVEEKVLADEKLQCRFESVESQKQDLIEKKEVIQELETEQLELEGSIQTDLLEEEKSEVEETKCRRNEERGRCPGVGDHALSIL